MTSLEFNQPKNQGSIIKVIGVGGGGSNAVNTMFVQGIKGVEFCVCNTDVKALDVSPVPMKVRLGETETEGLGAGADPLKGRAAAEESLEEIREILRNNTKMVFVTAGMGGGTGTGAAPVIARLAKEMNILTVGVVTTPFEFEGVQRVNKAKEGLKWMRDSVDTLLVINNDNLFTLDQIEDLTQAEAFETSDRVLFNAAKGISDIVNEHGEMGGINVDFADVVRVMRNGGTALMGSATFAGQDRGIKAAEEALSSPLLENVDIRGSKALLVNITANKTNLKISESKKIMDYIKEMAGEEAEVIMGTVYNPDMEDRLNVTVIATGFKDQAGRKAAEDMQESRPTHTSMESGYSRPVQTSEPTFIEVPVEPVASRPTVEDRQPSLFAFQDDSQQNKHTEDERRERIRNASRFTGSDLETRRKMEDEPAIDRLRGRGENIEYSNERVISRFSVEGPGLRFDENPYLHGQPD